MCSGSSPARTRTTLPTKRNRSFPRLDAPELVARLKSEHEQHDKIARKLTDALAHVPRARELAHELDAAYRAHTQLEDDELLPLVKALSEDDQAAAAKEMQGRRKDKPRR